MRSAAIRIFGTCSVPAESLNRNRLCQTHEVRFDEPRVQRNVIPAPAAGCWWATPHDCGNLGRAEWPSRSQIAKRIELNCQVESSI